MFTADIHPSLSYKARTRRIPRLLLRLSGALLLRYDTRQFVKLLFQLPPRFTRFEPFPINIHKIFSVLTCNCQHAQRTTTLERSDFAICSRWQCFYHRLLDIYGFRIKIVFYLPCLKTSGLGKCNTRKKEALCRSY